MKVQTDLKAGLVVGCGCGASGPRKHKTMPAGFVHTK